MITGYIGRHQVMKMLALDQQMTRPTSHCRRTLRAAAVVLALLVALLSTGCAQGPVVPADPTATYVPPPTATPKPTETPVSANQRFRSLPRAEVSINGSTLVYSGIIDQPSYNHFRRIIAAGDPVIKTVQIRSYGGVADISLKMGEWIYSKGLDVVVDDYCFSACANYIFTAGRNKVIRDDSVVGWHGANLTSEYMANDQGITLDEQLKQQFDASQEDEPINVESSAHYQALFNQYKRSYLRQVDDEHKFFEETGVKPELVTYGFLSENHEAMHTADNLHYSLWTFSIEDMGKFGVSNVSYESDGEYPSDLTLERYPDIVVLSLPE